MTAGPEIITVGEPRRADARRNISAIVEAAAEVLSRDSSASMQDVAEACGLHRATVHRHFASRVDLLVAVREHAFAEAARDRDRVLAAHGDPVQAIGAYVDAMLMLGNRYRVYRFMPVIDARNEQGRRAITAPVADVIAAGQEQGTFRRDVAPGELAVVLSGLIATTLPEIAVGRLSRSEAAALCVRMIRPVHT